MHGLRQLSAVLSARALVPRWRAPTVDLVRDSIFVGCDSTRLRRNRNTLMRALARYGFRRQTTHRGHTFTLSVGAWVFTECESGTSLDH